MTDSVSAPAPAQSDERALPVGPVTSNLKASIKNRARGRVCGGAYRRRTPDLHLHRLTTVGARGRAEWRDRLFAKDSRCGCETIQRGSARAVDARRRCGDGE